MMLAPYAIFINAAGLHLVLAVVAGLLLLSLLCGGSARLGFRRAPV
jgi:hypothetical protein